MIKIAVAEDKPSNIEQIKFYLQKIQKEVDLEIKVNFYTDGKLLVDKYKMSYDILILDIDMPNLDGMSAAKEIRKIDEDVTIIFLTKMAQYAIKGYEVRAIDFLLKPINYSLFSMKLKDIIYEVNSNNDIPVILTVSKSMRKIMASDIYYMEVSNHKLIVHTKKEVIKACGTLSNMEDKLREHNFVRCNSGFLVNLQHVVAIEKNSVKVGDDELIISRPKRKEFLRELTEFLGSIR